MSENNDYLSLVLRLSELRHILKYSDSYDYNKLGEVIDILSDKEKYNNEELMNDVKDYLSNKNFFYVRGIYDWFMPKINGKAWVDYIDEIKRLCNKILFNKMENNISIKNGKSYYIIKGEKQYTCLHYIHYDLEELFKTTYTIDGIYGTQETIISKIGNDEIEYYDKILKITSGWKNEYNNNSILEGKQWSVKINYNDKELSFFGSNEYPENWNEFEDFLEYITNNQNNKPNKKYTISMNNIELVENQNIYKKQLKYSLLELCIYNILLKNTKDKQTVFECACLLNEEKSKTYSPGKDLLYIQNDEFIINFLSEFFLKLKNNDKELYNQIIDEVIKDVTYYCMRNSDQLINIPVEKIKFDGINEIINLAHVIIDNE